MAAGWSELQGDLLELILEKLDLAEHARFASVCSSWRSVAVNNPPINKPLYFVLSHHPKRLVRRFITSFIPSWKRAHFIGALDAWLVILIDSKDLFLLNKGSNSMIQLPPHPKPNKFFQFVPDCKAVLSSPPSSSSSSSSGECTVFLSSKEAGLYYCRLGTDNSFSKLLDGCSRIYDILFHEGRLYVLCKFNHIIIFDHLLNKIKQSLDNFWLPILCHMLISENNLLMIDWWDDPVLVFEQSKSRVIRVENFNESLLLVRNNYCSLSITTKEHKEFRRDANCFKDRFHGTIVIDTSEDSNKAKVDDPWPLFFVVFNLNGIRSSDAKPTIL